jgi:hypothetical protein
MSVTFETTLDPEKNFGVHGLWAGVSTPEATSDCCEQKKGERTHDQQAGQIDEILRPQHHAKEIKLSGA